MERARASDPAAPDPDGGRRDDGEQGGVQGTPQDGPWGHGYAFQTGRGHAPVPEADPGSVASIIASLADSDDNKEISLLEEVSRKVSRLWRRLCMCS